MSVDEREAVFADPLDHDDGGGALGELDEVHEVEFEAGVGGRSS